MTNIDGCIKRRINIINYPFEFRDAEKITDIKVHRPINYELKEKTIHNKEIIQTFILMLIHKAYKYKDKSFKTPESILKHNDNYCSQNNDLNEWFTNHLIKTNSINDIIKSGDLLNHYNNSNDCIKKLRPVDFSKLIEKIGINKIEKNHIKYYTNLKYLIDNDRIFNKSELD